MAQALKTIEKYQMLAEDDCIIVGVSGGPDSVALLQVLIAAVEKKHCRLHVVHVNHKFRGEQADQEAQHVERWAALLGIPCSIYTEDVPALAAREGLSAEEAGHLVRFRCYHETAAAIGANKLALGHHRGDRAESVLLHLIQGCGLDGLATMPPKEGWLIRPLIELEKADLLDYCQAQGLVFFQDATNGETVYLRNKVRLELIPFLREKFNPGITENLVRLAEVCRGDQMYLMAQTEQAMLDGVRAGEQGGLILDLPYFQVQPLAIKRRIVRSCCLKLSNDGKNIGFAQTEAILQLADRDKGAKQLDLSGGILVKKSYGQISFQQKKASSAKIKRYCYKWQLNKPFYCEELACTFQAEFSIKPLHGTADMKQVVLDGAKLADVLTIRVREPGDRLRPLGSGGRQKLKEFWINRKVPQAWRDQLPVILSGDDIIWLPGYTIADAYKVTNQTRYFCKLSCL